MQDDIESAFWVLLWTTMVYSQSAQSSEELTNFIRTTFDCSPGGASKRAVFDSPSIFREKKILPGRQVLYDLIKQLIDLFHWFHYEPNDTEMTILDKLSNALPPLMASSDSDVSRLLDMAFQDLSAYKSRRAKGRLDDHTYVIELFSESLKKVWPADDAAQEQELISMDLSGVAPVGRVYMAKSKHVLEAVKEVQRRKRRKISQAKAPIHAADDPDLQSEELKSEEPVDEETESEESVDEETESDDLEVLGIGSSSLTLLSDSD
jgi:hypothetical protein